MPQFLSKLEELLTSRTPTSTAQSQLPAIVQQGIDIAKKQIPNMADVEMYGPIDRLTMSGTAALPIQGYTSVTGKIRLNPTAIASSTLDDIADTIIHEQQHVNQIHQRGGTLAEIWRRITNPDGTLPYGQRPDELGAFQGAEDAAYAAGRQPSARPSFDQPGVYFQPQDVNLTPDKKR